MSNASDIEALKKLALENVVELEAATQSNVELRASITKLGTVIDAQMSMLEAYRHAVELAKTGEIDASQIDEEVERIGKLGLTVYKEASLAPGAPDSFGEMVEENTPDGVEKTKVAHTLDGKPLTSIETWMLEWREIRKGIPAGIVYQA